MGDSMWSKICCSCCVDRYNSCNAGWFMKFLAKLLFIGSMCVAIVGIVGYSLDLYRHGRSRHLIGWFSAGGFVALTFVISIRQIVMHLLNWRVPGIQKYIVRILWMVPLYSVESWLALRFRWIAVYIETFRECYEAYVIYNFLHYIIALLGEESQLIVILKSKSRDRGVHVFPFNYLFWSDCWIPGPELLIKCKIGVLQYVIIKNIMAIIVFCLQSVHLYEEGHFKWNKGYGYISVINFMSQFVALYCLAYFYNATKENLAPFQPFGKFLCVKMVVFFTWAQSIVISILVSGKMENSDPEGSGSWTGEQISKGFQDFTICIEMFLFALAFNWAYPYQDFTSHVAKSPVRNAHTPKKFKDDGGDSAVVVGHPISKKHSKNSFDLSNKSPSPAPMESGGEERSMLLGADSKDESEPDSDFDLSGGVSKQPFFEAFLQSSIPRDVWEDIRNVNWKVEHSPAGPSGVIGDTSMSASASACACASHDDNGDDEEAARSLEMSLIGADNMKGGDNTAVSMKGTAPANTPPSQKKAASLPGVKV